MCVYCTTRDKSKKEKVYHVVLCFFISIIVKHTEYTCVCVHTEHREYRYLVLCTRPLFTCLLSPIYFYFEVIIYILYNKMNNYRLLDRSRYPVHVYYTHTCVVHPPHRGVFIQEPTTLISSSFEKTFQHTP